MANLDPHLAPLERLAHPERVARLRQWASSGGFEPQRSDELEDPEATRNLPIAGLADGTGHCKPRSLDQARGGNTAILLQRLSAAGQLEPSSASDAPFGWFHGWRIIGTGTRIDGGVYLGRKPREAIVVDMRRPGSALLELYETWLRSLRDGHSDSEVRRDLAEHLALRVGELVRAYMPYDEDAVRRLESRGLLQPDRPIDLDVFLNERGGVCRHQVCMVGGLLERLVDGGWLGGRVSLERKHVPGWFSHAWVRYDDAQGDEWILDPAQQRYGRVRDFEEAAKILYTDEAREPQDGSEPGAGSPR